MIMRNLFNTFPFFRQPDTKDCGPTCLRMIAKFYGKNYNIQSIRELCEINKEGVSMFGLKNASQQLGFQTIAAEIDFETLITRAPLPCIAHWKQNHFVVIIKADDKKVVVADPANAVVKHSKEEFMSFWSKSEQESKGTGFVLLFEPTEAFKAKEGDSLESIELKFIKTYVLKYKALLAQLLISILSIVIFQIAFPFLTKSIIDVGIAQKSTSYIFVVLLAQLGLFIGRTTVDILRSWIVLFIGARVNISLISDFFWKVLKLPLKYFDSKATGDLLQRVNDYKRVEQFVTSSAISILFSFLSVITFSFFLAYYSLNILLVFIAFSVAYVFWVLFFLDKRKKIDYQRFEMNAKNSDNIIQMIDGVYEIKLNNWERIKVSTWEIIQAQLYSLNIKSLSIEQVQQIGASFINELKNIFIVFLSAKLVIDGKITLGTMLAVQYVIGQLNSPLEQFVQFAKIYQDASLSLARLNEVFSQDEEEKQHVTYKPLPQVHDDIYIDNVTFAYPGAGNKPVLHDIDIVIPHNKTTAIVGTSGSGKTTLIKLLLKFYSPHKGDIKIGNESLSSFKSSEWREKCGAVMQEGFIFSDTIVNNIAGEENNIDKLKLINSCKIANIYEFIESLPLGFNTRIGINGMGISQGQKQRILIARAVYKDPEFIFLDEATNSLDSTNEREIIENLQHYLTNKTVVVIAHRLSTVRNADQILVLDRGRIVEVGNHDTLISFKGVYHTLIKNQLELAS